MELAPQVVVRPFEQLAEELHKPIKRKFQRRHVDVFEIDDVWGADLVDMREWIKQNKGFKYMLNVIDVFSKYAWSIPMKDKTGKTTLEAFRKIAQDSRRIPKHLWVDRGLEFYNKDIDSWLKKNDIVRYSTYGEHKSVVVERFNRTLKEMMWKRFTAENTRKWIDMLDDLLKIYNNSRVHSTIGMTPENASLIKNKVKVFQNIINNTRLIPKAARFKVGDKVRISRTKALFEKGYLPNWSEELYIIDQIQKTIPVTYKLKDLLGDEIKGSFYNEELQKSTQEVYRVEKVIRKKKINGVEHALVKWSGYSDKHNSWLSVKELEKLN